MKKIYFILCLFATLMISACTGELDQTPNIETTSGDVYTSVANYKTVLAKLYASFVVVGQEKGSDADLSSNNGQDYMRCYINMQECGTDEMASTWLEGDKVSDLTYISWDANDPWVSDMYYRIYYTIALCNEFLRNASDDAIAGFSESDQNTIRQFCAEARFLRAMAYYHALDLFHNGPFVTENDPVGAYIPPRYSANQLFTYIESELKDIEGSLLTSSACEYGRACNAAAWTLLAKLYLNAEVYVGEDHYTDCITYCNKIISNGYSLESDYARLFNADNHKRTNEIIFPLCVDATHTVSWGATTYLICGEVGNSSDYMNPADYGVASGWGMFRVRGELSALFADGDKRGMFFTEGQTQYLDKAIDDQTCGYYTTKWSNLTDAGEAASNTADAGVSTDYPMFRLADVYLMLAESVVRGGTGSSKSLATGYVNQLRNRAFGNANGNITESDLTASFILDERARELYWESTRRTDLIRYGRFTTADYLWQWKGGVKDGKAVDAKYNIYPIPSTELTANPNLSNENY